MKTAFDWRGVVALVAVLVLLPWATAVATTGLPCRYEIAHVIASPPCIFQNGVTAPGISPNGRYVCGGITYCETGDLFVFDTQTGQLNPIPIPADAISIWPVDITDDRIMCGYYVRVGAGDRGFVYDTNTLQWTDLPPIDPDGRSFATAINANGEVCGTRSIGSPGDPAHPVTAFIWSAKNGFTDVGLIDGYSTFGNDISDTGVMVGSIFDNFLGYEEVRGFVFQDGKATALDVVPDGFSSVALNVNTSESIVIAGMVQLDPIMVRTFVLQGGRATLLPVPPGTERCGSVRITNGGLIGGNCNSAATPFPWRPCLWKGDQFLPVHLVLPPGQYVYQVYDMSDDGTMVLEVVGGGSPRCVVASPVWPHPGDANCDEVINVDDLLGVINAWGPCVSGCSTDFDENLVTNVLDLLVVIQNWD